MTRVFITGLGALTPIGNDAPTFWRNLLAGKSGRTINTNAVTPILAIGTKSLTGS